MRRWGRSRIGLGAERRRSDDSSKQYRDVEPSSHEDYLRVI
jgi:hypothetical protein